MIHRILYVVGQLRAGGLERQLCFLLETIDRDRYHPAVVVWHFREDDMYVGCLRELKVPIYYPPSQGSGWSKLKWMRALARELNPEVVHSYSFYTNFGAWYAAAGTNAVAVGSVRSDFSWAMSESGFYLGRLCARWPRAQIFNSFAGAQSARNSQSIFSPEEIFVVRNGLDLGQFTMTPLPNGTQPKPTIVGVGSLAAVKRWDRLLRICSRLKQEGLDFSVKIAGDGPLRQSLTNQTKDLGIANCVQFIGQSSNIPALLSEATLLVHCSDSEGCPNVLMEAMACGRPVVATDAGDTPLLIEDGRTGFVVPRENEDAFARRVAMLMSTRALCKRMGEAGRAKAEKEFGLDRLVEETLNAYRSAGWQAPLSSLSQISVLP